MKFHLSGSKLYPDFDTESEIYKMISIMKFLPLSMALLGLLRSAGTQEKSSPAWNVEIPGTISDGTRAQPDPKPEPIDFRVLTSRTQRLQVTEAAEMSGLPPIKGTINVTVQRVADPGTPDPPAPLPALPPNDPLDPLPKISSAIRSAFCRRTGWFLGDLSGPGALRRFCR